VKAVLVSLRFNPGHLSHLIANHKLLKESGFAVSLRINPLFIDLAENRSLKDDFSGSYVPGLRRADLFIVWFPSVGALLEMLRVRVSSDATIVYVNHEPYTSIRSYRESGFGVRKSVRIALVGLVGSLLAWLSHKVILPSARALVRFEETNYLKKPCAKINLMFDDESTPQLLESKRLYVSYIGTIAEDHAFDDFVRFMDYVSNSSIGGDVRFLIATKSDIPPDCLSTIERCERRGTVKVVCGAPLSNTEINRHFSSSLVVWNAYRRSMQSGVLAKAYMFGTPVLTSAASPSEFFVANVTGQQISADYDPSEILAAIETISRNFNAYSVACRRYFLEHFYYSSLKRSFLDFVTSP
jgi:hypothetical protein